MDNEVVKAKIGSNKTSTFLALFLFQTTMAANLFLVLGLRRNIPLFHGVYAHILIVISNTCTMVGFLECLHGFGHIKIVLSSFGGMFYVIMCVLYGPNGENISFKSIPATVFLFLILFIPAIADLFKVRMSKSRIISMTIFETLLGMMLVA